MPRPLTEQEREAFLADLHVATLSVASDSDRPPLTVPVWYHYQPGGDVTFFTHAQGGKTRKVRLIAKVGVLSLSVQKETAPYKFVTIEGTVTKTDRSPTPEQVLAIVGRYLPPEMAQGYVQDEFNKSAEANDLVLYTVRPDRWITFDFS
jgi:uncharacterized protein